MKNHEHGTLLRRWAVGLALAAVSVVASAQTISNATGGFSASAAGNVTTFGSAVASPPWATTPGATPYTAGNIGFASDGSVVWGQGSTKMPLPEGRTASVLVKAPITKAAAAAAIAKFAFKVAAPLSTAYALYELVGDLGLVPGQTADGKVSYHPLSSAVTWRAQSGYAQFSSPSAIGLCSQIATTEPERQGSPELHSCSADQNAPGATCVCKPWSPNWGTEVGIEAYGNGTTPAPGPALTEQELADRIAAMSGWPTGGVKTLAEAIAAGEVVVYTPPLIVSGPATVQGPTTSKQVTGPQGNTTTTTTNTYNQTYQGNTVTTTVTTVTTTTNPDGSTTTTTEGDEPEAEDPSKDECEAHPDRVGCATLDEPEQTDIPTATRALTYVAENIGLSASCPAPIVKTIGGQSITVFSYDKGCEILANYVKPMILLLSAWIAFFIVMPGKTE